MRLIKISTILLLGFTLVAGLLIPLDKALMGSLPSQLHPGKQTVTAFYYRGNLKEIKNIRIWAFHKNSIIRCKPLQIKNQQTFSFSIQVPDTFPSKNVGLVIDHENKRDTLFGALYFMSTVSANTSTYEEKISLDKYNNKKSIIFPNREILRETIRNLFFHVPMWFTMMFLAFISVFFGIKYLKNGNIVHDIISDSCARIALLFGIFGLLTGSLWAKFTWGQWWVTEDVKLNGAAFTVLIYIAYTILRSSINDEIQRAKISGIYNIFAFIMMMVFVMVIPRLSDSLHPGNGGNPAFSNYDLDSSLRMVFYPAVLGWIGLGYWIANLKIRLSKIKLKMLNA
jgi:heme exporter protein C